jgi:hypothetical protein
MQLGSDATASQHSHVALPPAAPYSPSRFARQIDVLAVRSISCDRIVGLPSLYRLPIHPVTAVVSDIGSADVGLQCRSELVLSQKPQAKDNRTFRASSVHLPCFCSFPPVPQSTARQRKDCVRNETNSAANSMPTSIPLSMETILTTGNGWLESHQSDGCVINGARIP